MVDLEKIRALAERVAGSQGLAIVEIEFRGGAGKQRMLRAFIEKNAEAQKQQARSGNGALTEVSSAPVQFAGITHDDCSNFSLEFGTLLDVEELIPGGTYTLEVSSPGLDRKLNSAADYERFAGSLIKIATREPIRGNRHWQGRLQSFAEGKLQLRIESAKKKQGKNRKQKEQDGSGTEQSDTLTVELGNVERANLIPEI